MMNMLGRDGASQPNFESLDPPLLLKIFSFMNPLPDIFNVAATCKRLRDLVHTRRSWLIVTHDPSAPIIGIPHEYRHQFTTLAAAVAASRPGDTILIEPGPPHTAANIIIPHPLHIMGGGSSPAQAVLQGLKGAPAVIDFRSTGRVSNLTIEAQVGACVMHQQGRVRIEKCVLRCAALGLPHLVAPIVSTAGALHRSLGFAQGQRTMKDGCDHPAAAGCLKPLLTTWSGPGSLSIVETVIEGGGQTVHIKGAGVLQAVRAMCLADAVYYWMDVICPEQPPGIAGHIPANTTTPAHVPSETILDRASDQQQEESTIEAIQPSTSAAISKDGPSWGNVAAFDPVAFKKKVQSNTTLVPNLGCHIFSDALHCTSDHQQYREKSREVEESILRKRAGVWSSHHVGAAALDATSRTEIDDSQQQVKRAKK